MNAKSLTLVLLLAVTTVVLRLRGDTDIVPASAPLQDLSNVIGPWHGTDVPLPADELQILGNGSFLNRTYDSPAHVPLTLLIAYFPSQRSGDAIHSPLNCLPGSGWAFESAGRTDLTDTAGLRHRVGRYVIANGPARYMVLYWYRSQGRDIPGDYTAKAHLLLQSIRDRRTDGALIRVMTPILPGEPERPAQQRLTGFTAHLDPLLPSYLPD